MSSKYFLLLFLMTPRAPIPISIVFPFIPHILYTSISRSLYFDSFSVTLVEMFLSVGIAISIRRQLFSSLYIWIISGLFAFISRSVYTGTSNKIVAFLVFYHRIWLMLIPFIWDIDVKVSADIPVYICCNLVISVYLFCLGKFRASRCYVSWNRPHIRQLGSVRFFKYFGLHVFCLESLILCCYN